MKVLFVFALLCAAAFGQTNIKVVAINVGSSGSPSQQGALTITNAGSSAQSIASWTECTEGVCGALVCFSTTSGSANAATSLAASETAACNALVAWNGTAASVEIKTDAGTVAGFVQWEAGNQLYAADAVAAGVWDSVTNFANGTGQLVNVAISSGGYQFINAQLSLSANFSGVVTTPVVLPSGTVTYNNVIIFAYLAFSPGTVATFNAFETAGVLAVGPGSTLHIGRRGGFTVSGSATLSGVLILDVDTTSFGGVNCTGVAKLGGTVQFNVLSTFVFNVGDVIVFMRFASKTGAFTTTSATVGTATRGGVRAGSATSATIACGTTSCTATGASATTPAPSSSSSSGTPTPQDVAIGVGVGIGVGVPVLIALAVLLYCCCCRTAPKATPPPPATAAAAGPRGAGQAGQPYSGYSYSGYDSYGGYSGDQSGDSYGDDASGDYGGDASGDYGGDDSGY